MKEGLFIMDQARNEVTENKDKIKLGEYVAYAFGGVEKPKATLTQALRNVYIEGGRYNETDLPVYCVITDHIPYNDLGKVDVHKILTKEITGKTYNVEAQYTNDVLTDVKLVRSEYAPGQMKPKNKR